MLLAIPALLVSTFLVGVLMLGLTRGGMGLGLYHLSGLWGADQRDRSGCGGGDAQGVGCPQASRALDRGRVVVQRRYFDRGFRGPDVSFGQRRVFPSRIYPGAFLAGDRWRDPGRPGSGYALHGLAVQNLQRSAGGDHHHPVAGLSVHGSGRGFAACFRCNGGGGIGHVDVRSRADGNQPGSGALSSPLLGDALLSRQHSYLFPGRPGYRRSGIPGGCGRGGFDPDGLRRGHADQGRCRFRLSSHDVEGG